MRRLFLWFALTAMAVTPQGASAAYGRTGYVDPAALGQQVQAKVADGELLINRQQTFMVQEQQTRTEVRTKVVEVDGEKREERVTVEVPVTVTKPVAATMQQRLSLDNVQAFDMQGKRVGQEQLTDALKEERTVLLASRKVPRYYLTIYKPDTLLLVVESQQAIASPLPSPAVAPPKVEPPKILPAPAVPATPDAPPALEAPKADAPKPGAPRKIDSPRTLPAPAVPAPPGEAPRTLPAPTSPAPGAPLASVSGSEPQVSMARIVDDKIGLRRYVKDIASETAYREEEVGGARKLAPIQIEVESITDVERKYPQDLVKFSRVDKKPLADDEIAKLKDAERCVLVSADGKEIDPKYLKIIKPDALIVVTPIMPNALHLTPPVGLPALPVPTPPATP